MLTYCLVFSFRKLETTATDPIRILPRISGLLEYVYEYIELLILKDYVKLIFSDIFSDSGAVPRLRDEQHGQQPCPLRLAQHQPKEGVHQGTVQGEGVHKGTVQEEGVHKGTVQ